MLEKNPASTAPAADGSAQPSAATPDATTDPHLVAPGSADSAVARIQGLRPSGIPLADARA